MKYRSICSVAMKSAITPSRMGRIVSMLSGVRPSMALAFAPTASTSRVPLRARTATTDGSSVTMPRPSTWTSVLAVPRSIAISSEKTLATRRRMKLEAFGTVSDRHDRRARARGAGHNQACHSGTKVAVSFRASRTKEPCEGAKRHIRPNAGSRSASHAPIRMLQLRLPDDLWWPLTLDRRMPLDAAARATIA